MPPILPALPAVGTIPAVSGCSPVHVDITVNLSELSGAYFGVNRHRFALPTLPDSLNSNLGYRKRGCKKVLECDCKITCKNER